MRFGRGNAEGREHIGTTRSFAVIVGYGHPAWPPRGWATSRRPVVKWYICSPGPRSRVATRPSPRPAGLQARGGHAECKDVLVPAYRVVLRQILDVGRVLEMASALRGHLAPGTYALRFSLPGFGTLSRREHTRDDDRCGRPIRATLTLARGRLMRTCTLLRYPAGHGGVRGTDFNS
jgi:hypothetical protein